MAAPSTPANARPVAKHWPLYVVAICISGFFLIPMYLIAVSAFSSQADILSFPKVFYPVHATLSTLRFFLTSQGVLPSILQSLVVAVMTLVFSTLLGAPAGYGLARYVFPGRDAYKLFILLSRAFPIAILAVPLAVTFLNWGIYDTAFDVALVHTALVLPTTILITSSIFLAVPDELEEAALTLGCTPVSAFARVALPLAIPGIAASTIFAFTLSWNEVFAASILTLQHPTLPALVVGALTISPLPYRFAGGFILLVPSLIFIFFTRRYLLGLWGGVSK